MPEFGLLMTEFRTEYSMDDIRAAEGRLVHMQQDHSAVEHHDWQSLLWRSPSSFLVN